MTFVLPLDIVLDLYVRSTVLHTESDSDWDAWGILPSAPQLPIIMQLPQIGILPMEQMRAELDAALCESFYSSS